MTPAYSARRTPADVVIALVILDLEDGDDQHRALARILYRFLDGRVLNTGGAS